MMLITRPNDDHGTNYLYYWSKPVIDVAKKRNIEVTDLFAKKASKRNFVSYYKKYKHKLVFLNGHGFDNLITGYNGDVLIDDDKNKLYMIGSVMVARSCRCARILGNFLVKNGLVAFAGYLDDYIVKTSRKYTTKPWLDPMAALFLEPSNVLVESLLKRKTIGEANDKSKRMLAKNISKILAGRTKDKDDTVRCLYHDFKNQVVIGDKNAIAI